MIPVNTLLWTFVLGIQAFALAVFLMNPEALNLDALTVPFLAWGNIAVSASLFLLVNQWVYGVLCRHRARNKRSEPREHTDER